MPTPIDRSSSHDIAHPAQPSPTLTINRLGQAALFGQNDTLRHLLSLNTDPESVWHTLSNNGSDTTLSSIQVAISSPNNAQAHETVKLLVGVFRLNPSTLHRLIGLDKPATKGTRPPLHLAARLSRPACIPPLLDGLSREELLGTLRTADDRGCIPLHMALLKTRPDARTATIHALLRPLQVKDKVSVMLTDMPPNGATAMHLAANIGDIESINALLSHVPNDAARHVVLNARDKQGRTPLYWAVTSGFNADRDNTVQALLAAQPNDEYQRQMLYTPLKPNLSPWQHICSTGQTGAVQAIARACQSTASRENILQALVGYPELQADYMDELIRLGFFEQQLDELMQAAQKMLQAERFSALTSPLIKPQSALHIICQLGTAEQLKSALKLLDDPADRLRCLTKETPPMPSAIKWQLTQADDTERTNKLNTLLSALHTDELRLDLLGKTESILDFPLIHQIAARGDVNFLKAALDSLEPMNAERILNLPALLGYTPLYAAIEGGHLGMVKLLLDEGANPVGSSASTKNGEHDSAVIPPKTGRMTCLNVALALGRADILECLIDHLSISDLQKLFNTPNMEGQRPAKQAEQLGQPEVTEIIQRTLLAIKHGAV